MYSVGCRRSLFCGFTRTKTAFDIIFKHCSLVFTRKCNFHVFINRGPTVLYLIVQLGNSKKVFAAVARKWSQNHVSVDSRIRTVVGWDDCPIFQLWLSEGRTGLDHRYGENVDPAAFFLLNITCAKSEGTPLRASSTFLPLKPRRYIWWPMGISRFSSTDWTKTYSKRWQNKFFFIPD